MEAKQALELSPNDVEALETLSEALIFTGTPDEGRKLAEQAMRLNPTLPARALYLVGLSHFAEGNFQEAATHIERALRHAPTVSENAGVLAAAYGKLGLEEKAVGAYETYRKAYQDIDPSVELAIVEYPFSDAGILESLADGFEKAGAGDGHGHGHGHDIGPSRYLRLHSGTKLDGKEIKSLLFGRTIKGITWPYNPKRPWSQVRTEDGKVTHGGLIRTYPAAMKAGLTGRPRANPCTVLRWPAQIGETPICPARALIDRRSLPRRWSRTRRRGGNLCQMGFSGMIPPGQRPDGVFRNDNPIHGYHRGQRFDKTASTGRTQDCT